MEESEKAMELLLSMYANDVPRTRNTHLSETLVLARVGKTEAALEKLFQLHNNGIVPDLIIINAVLTSIEKDRRVEHVPDVIRAMRLWNLEPDVRSYVRIIAVYLNDGYLNEAFMVMRRLINDPQNLQVPLLCFDNLVRGFALAGRTEDAILLLNIVECPLPPRQPLHASDGTVATLLIALMEKGRCAEAKTQFDKLFARRSTPCPQMLNALLMAMTVGHQWQEIRDVLERMSVLGQPVAQPTYTHIIETARKVGPQGFAEQLQAELDLCGVEPEKLPQEIEAEAAKADA
jgi:hypothetical protein